MRRAHYRITSPVRFFTFILFVVVLTVFGLSTVISANSAEAATVNTYKQITVQSNDSLWSIADDYCDESEDVRDKIDELKEINDLSGDELHAGDVLFVPVG